MRNCHLIFLLAVIDFWRGMATSHMICGWKVTCNLMCFKDFIWFVAYARYMKDMKCFSCYRMALFESTQFCCWLPIGNYVYNPCLACNRWLQAAGCCVVSLSKYALMQANLQRQFLVRAGLVVYGKLRFMQEDRNRSSHKCTVCIYGYFFMGLFGMFRLCCKWNGHM